MASIRTRTRARERVEASCAAAQSTESLRRQVLDVLREVLGFDAYVWLLTDPVTAVGAAPIADIPCLNELPALVKAKYATTINRWTVLRHAAAPVGLLARSVGGDLAQSRVWSEVMSRYGIVDVASVVFADQFGCWGFLDLWRQQPRRHFDDDDADFLALLAPALTMGLRAGQAATFVEPATTHRGDLGPVVLTLNDNLDITSRTAASRAWLDALLPPRPDERGVPASVYNVAAQLLAAEAGIDDQAASTRVHLADGYWLTLRAARLAGDDRAPATTAAGRGPIVVTIEESSASERLDLFARTFAFTSKEHELIGLLANGGDTRAIAHAMSVSVHTVQDHLKSIFAKTGGRDRITILSRALGARPEPTTGSRRSR